MKSPWRLRDYVFAAFMTIGMVASVFVIGPFVPPFLDLVAWAPFGGIFLTLGMARLQHRGSIALMILPLALLLAPLSLFITLYLVLTTVVAEAVVFFCGNYRAKRNRLLGTVVFFVSAVVIGLGSIVLLANLVNAGTVPGDGLAEMLSKFATLLNNPWLIGVLAIVTGILGTVGWWMGESIVQQLRRAGKLDADS
ncbi:MAG: MptD family putative ECF transporter S component [Cyanobacteria bacterium J06635_15]